MLTSCSVSQNDDGTTSHLKFSYKNTGSTLAIYGDLDVTNEEATIALQSSTTDDIWAGFRNLIIQKLHDEK